MKQLSVTQRETIRRIADNPNSVDSVHQRTYDSLAKRGIIHAGSGQLTAYGRRVHKSIMASGDGPEALKELLRFPR